MIRAIILMMTVAIAAVLSGDYPPSAQASYVIGGTCSDGYHKYPSGHAEYCPKVITQLSTEPSDTSFTVTGMVDSTGGTIYASATLGACGTPLHWQQIQAGAPDEASQSASLSSTSFSLELTGLSDETAYCAQVVAVSTAGFVSVILSQNVTTEATAGPPSGDAITGGDDYFAGTGGSDAASGTSNANRWANYPATETLSAGSDMWLRNDTVFNKRKMFVSRQGSAANHNEIGSYYMDGGTATKAIRGTHALAIMRGGLTQACLDAKTCTFYPADFTADDYNGVYDYQIEISATADYTDLGNLRIEYIRAGGVGVFGSGSAGSLTNVFIDGLEVQYSIGNNVTMANGVRSSVIVNSSADYGGVCYGIWQIRKDASTNDCGTYWPGAFTLIRDRNAQILMENNTVTGFFGESVTAFDRCDHFVMRGNFTSNIHSGAYINGCTDAVVENNIFLGGDKSVGISTVIGSSRYGGFGVSKEGSYMDDPQRIYIRNNIVIGWQSNLNVLTAYVSTPWTSYIWGNTTIGATLYHIRGSNTGIAELGLVNNVIWNQDLDAATVCINAVSSLAADHNAWYNITPSDGDCKHASDVYTNPLLTESDYEVAKAYGFQSYANGKDYFSGIVDDVTPQAGSPLKNAGAAMTTTVLTHADYGIAVTEMADIKDATITAANWAKQLYYDFNNNPRGATPTIGAIE